MQISAVLFRWIDALASLVMAWRQSMRARRSLTVRRDRGAIIVRQSDTQTETTVPETGSAVPAELASAARRGLVIFEPPASDVIERRITVPAQAKDFLSGIVRNQIERLSPWVANETVYGFAAQASQAAASTLDVRVSITSRASVDKICDELTARGLSIDRVVAQPRETDGGAAILIWSRLGDAPEQGLRRTRHLILGAIAACLVATVGLCSWALLSAAGIESESADLAARSKVLQRQFQDAHSPKSIASLRPAERLWSLKASSPSAVIVLEALSRALPDAAYLTELHLEGLTVRLAGLTSDAPSLIAPLEQSGHLTNVHFSAPTTKAADGALYTFHIEAKVEPSIAIAGD